MLRYHISFSLRPSSTQVDTDDGLCVQYSHRRGHLLVALFSVHNTVLAQCIRTPTTMTSIRTHVAETPDSAVAPTATWQHCLRWSRRRHGYRPAGEVLRTDRYSVEPIEEALAKRFVVENHYSGSFPAARYRVGMFEHQEFRRPALVGVAVFSVPMTAAVIAKHLGVPASQGVELGRLVLLDEVPANGESFMLGKAFRLLRRALPDLKGVVSFCDPMPRHDAEGREVKRSHTGVIYRAHNAAYRGRGLPRNQLLMPNGACANERALSKIRNEERGKDYVIRQLLDAGAPNRLLGESLQDWLVRLRQERFLRSVRHPGNHVFTWDWGARSCGSRHRAPLAKRAGAQHHD